MGLVAPRLMLGSVVAVLALAFGASNAVAVTFDFTVSPTLPIPGEETTFQLTPTSADVNQVRWDLDGDGAFDDGGARTAKHTYATPGPVTVSMRAREEKDSPFQVVTKTITVDGPPAADFGFTPTEPFAGQAVAFTPAVNDSEGDDVTLNWSFGDGDTSTAGAPSHAYAAAGTYNVVLTATDEHGAVTTVEHTVTVASDPGPTPAFSYLPQDPLTGDTVTFSSSSTASQGSITATEWDLDGDGTFADASGPEATWVFDTPGDHLVQMRVTQQNGRSSVAFAHIEVAAGPALPPDGSPPADNPPAETPPAGTAPPTGSTGSGGTAAPAKPRRMRPFPIVRIAGVILPHGARVRILSVRAPRGARVSVRCSGHGCPAATEARTTATGLVRMHRFERRLLAGVKLELFVRKANRIGKYTRFVIRAGKAPTRVDRCLMPGGKRPVRCP
jgi:PKD repeat protein